MWADSHPPPMVVVVDKYSVRRGNACSRSVGRQHVWWHALPDDPRILVFARLVTCTISICLLVCAGVPLALSSPAPAFRCAPLRASLFTRFHPACWLVGLGGLFSLNARTHTRTRLRVTRTRALTCLPACLLLTTITLPAATWEGRAGSVPLAAVLLPSAWRDEGLRLLTPLCYSLPCYLLPVYTCYSGHRCCCSPVRALRAISCSLLNHHLPSLCLPPCIHLPVVTCPCYSSS